MPYSTKDPKRNNDFDNHPYGCFRAFSGGAAGSCATRQRLGLNRAGAKSEAQKMQALAG